MKRLVLMAAFLILPVPVAGGSSSLVEKLMQDSTTTNLGKKSSEKKSYFKDPTLNPALQDIGKEIDGRLEAGQMLQDKLEARGSQGEDARMKNKRQGRAKKQRWRERYKESQKP